VLLAIVSVTCNAVELGLILGLGLALAYFREAIDGHPNKGCNIGN